MQRRILIVRTIIGLLTAASLFSACSTPVPAPTAPPPPVPTTSSPIAPTAPAAPKAEVKPADCIFAFIFPDLASDLPALQAGLKEEAEKNNCKLELFPEGSQPDKMAGLIVEAAQKKVTGIIIRPLDDERVEKALQEAKIPVVVVGDQSFAHMETSWVIPDMIDGANKGAAFLCRAIHEQGRVIEVGGSQEPLSHTFTTEFQAQCPEVKLEDVSPSGWNEQTIIQALQKSLADNPDLTGVFAYNNTALAAAAKATQDAGILGVIIAGIGQGFENAGSPEIGAINAVIRPADREIGKAAVKAVVEQAKGGAVRPQIITPMEIHTNDIAYQLPPNSTARRITIGVLLPDANSIFSQQVYRGLTTTARSLDNVTLKIRSAGGSPEKMVRDLEWMVKAGVNGILLAALDSPNLEKALEKALGMGIPVVSVGPALPIQKLTSQVRFDEFAEGYKAGEALCAALNGAGVMIDAYQNGDAPEEKERSRGLNEFLAANCPEIQVIAKPLPADEAAACKELQQPQAETPGGLFAHSDRLALCAAQAPDGPQKARFITGSGATQEAIQAILNGQLFATIGQYPYEMGTIGMETLIESLYGKPVEADKPFPVNVITKDSIQQP